MNFTVRPAFLAHKANEEGIGTVRIAVTINRAISYHATTYRIYKTQWDPKRRLVVARFFGYVFVLFDCPLTV